MLLVPSDAGVGRFAVDYLSPAQNHEASCLCVSVLHFNMVFTFLCSIIGCSLSMCEEALLSLICIH
jgi:hypothetical protein